MSAKTGKAVLTGVIGHPVAHSLSPSIHEYWLHKHNIDGAYIPLDSSPDTFTQDVNHLIRLGFKGFNITLPHKEAAYQLADEVDEIGRLCGAVNTLYMNNNTLCATNTDVFGFMQNLKIQTKENYDKSKAWVVGAGGAARAAIVGLTKDGVSDIVIANRNQDKAEQLKESLLSSGSITANISIVPLSQQPDSTVTLLVNATQLGMKSQPELDCPLDALPNHCIVYDIVYSPLETKLLKEAKQYGLDTVDGLGMLLWQAAPGFALWYGKHVEVDAPLTALVKQRAGL